ncbi:uncharacterized protein BP5553_03800 [Venustampulla echinocandica]|uniref:Major facilitator superfamily (MFS) profile domain-containing protein n=1 Tax=Venustampulla echinocandica TaxID=2656787 RepID=A0A370TVC5_9HELO|nr:uncharacterized protein BP5553_03800 [Venustampulla echinocandica]RDL39460.1 hypothetical protein BP5553_03800 [Venustampulla echinocandica]
MATHAVQAGEARSEGDTPDGRHEASNTTRDTSNPTVKEKNQAQHSAPTVSHGETLPGWTIMRPLRMRARNNNRARHTADGNLGGNEDGIVDGDKKGSDDLKVTETNDTGDGSRGVGEVESAGDLRSDDELLDEDEQEDGATRQQHQHHVRAGGGGSQHRGENGLDGTADVGVGEFKVYKRRWFGLVQLVLLNIIVSWDWLTFSASSNTAAQYYEVSESAVNWLSTAFLFAFVVAAPLTIYTLHRGGPKHSIVTASVLLLLGNWIRYGSTKAGTHGSFGGVLFGQILTGLAQPFVLSAPTRYSDLWFTNRGRVAATAVMSLANPFGGALAQLIGPMWAVSPGDIPNLVLYIAIISTVASVPSLFLPAAPPTPSSVSGTTPKQPVAESLKFLFTSPEFYMILIPFWLYVALFNSLSSLINQVLEPYAFSETDAGIAGALLIAVGLVTSAITSPIIDRTKSYLIGIKIQVPIIGLAYLAYTWAPQTRSIAAIYTILSVLGAASFSLVPVVLEYLIEITHPVSPGVSSTICWTGGQLLGGIFILISDALRDSGVNDGTADDGTTRPPGNMYRALVFQTVMALVAVPLPLMLGCFGRGHRVRMRRIDADKETDGIVDQSVLV